MSDSVTADVYVGHAGPVFPVSVVSSWHTGHEAPDVADADYRSGASMAADHGERRLAIAGKGTGILVRFVYPSATVTGGPTVRVHGFDGKTWHSLRGSGGGRDVELAIDGDNDDDLGDGMQASKPVFLDGEGVSAIVLGVVTAADSSGGHIEVKVL